MALVVVVTRDVADRFRGFLASVMLDVSAGVYVSPRMNKGVRERTWSVLADWHARNRRAASSWCGGNWTRSGDWYRPFGIAGERACRSRWDVSGQAGVGSIGCGVVR
jgi:CRISPR-associated endoribonuclease Cas2 subtype I-E